MGDAAAGCARGAIGLVLGSQLPLHGQILEQACRSPYPALGSWVHQPPHADKHVCVTGRSNVNLVGSKMWSLQENFSLSAQIHQELELLGTDTGQDCRQLLGNQGCPGTLGRTSFGCSQPGPRAAASPREAEGCQLCTRAALSRRCSLALSQPLGEILWLLVTATSHPSR